ncbi:MAG TPA: mechanosensitive ion channel family protein [Acidimicrobiales bacterium]|nr:mechanosensitive ion channel family protein [Acidimicrobiales bacterium]
MTIDDLSRWGRGNGLEIVLLVLGAMLLTRFTSWCGQRLTSRIDAVAPDNERDTLVRSEQAKHLHALTQVLTWTTNVLICFVLALFVLRRLDVPLTSLVAPATVIGVAVGFGAQRIVQDLLAGFFIISERQYGFGDVVRISQPGTSTGVMGTVEDVTLRVTRLRTSNGELLTMPNGEIRQVTNFSRDWARAVIDVPVSSEVAITHVTDILRDVGESSFRDEALRPLLLDPPTVMGVESFEVGSFKVRVVARTLPGKQFDVGRELRARIARAFQGAGIGVSSSLLTAATTAS